jgi:hypothetical protein
MTVDTTVDASADVAYRRASIVDILDRVLATGVVVTGDVTLSIAEVDLVRVSLRALIESVRADTALVRGSEEQRDD